MFYCDLNLFNISKGQRPLRNVRIARKSKSNKLAVLEDCSIWNTKCVTCLFFIIIRFLNVCLHLHFSCFFKKLEMLWLSEHAFIEIHINNMFKGSCSEFVNFFYWKRVLTCEANILLNLTWLSQLKTARKGSRWRDGMGVS